MFYLNISIYEKIMYIIVFALAAIDRFVLNIKNPEQLYYNIMNSSYIVLIYIPIFLFIILNKLNKKSLAEIIVRFKDIYSFGFDNIKDIFVISLRVSLVFNLILLLFMYLCDFNIITNLSLWIFFAFSFIIQLSNWIIISFIFMVLTMIFMNYKLSYILEVVGFISLNILKSPTSYINLPNALIEYINFTMLILDFSNYNYINLFKIVFINIAIISILAAIYLKIIKSKDILVER